MFFVTCVSSIDAYMSRNVGGDGKNLCDLFISSDSNSPFKIIFSDSICQISG